MSTTKTKAALAGGQAAFYTALTLTYTSFVILPHPHLVKKRFRAFVIALAMWNCLFSSRNRPFSGGGDDD